MVTDVATLPTVAEAHRLLGDDETVLDAHHASSISLAIDTLDEDDTLHFDAIARETKTTTTATRSHGAERRGWLFYRFMTPRDDLLLGVGLISAVANGVLVGVTPLVVAEALVRLSVTPVDTAAAFSAARQLFWNASGVFVLTCVSGWTLDAAATRQLKRLYLEVARRTLYADVVPSNQKNREADTSNETAKRLAHGMGRALGDLVRAATQCVVAVVLLLWYLGGLQKILLAVIMTAVATAWYGGLAYVLCLWKGMEDPETPLDKGLNAVKHSAVWQTVAHMRTVAARNAQATSLAIATAIWKDEEPRAVGVGNYWFLRVATVIASAWIMVGNILKLYLDSVPQPPPVECLGAVLSWSVLFGSATQAVVHYRSTVTTWGVVKSRFVPILDADLRDDDKGLVPDDCQGAIDFASVRCMKSGELNITIPAGDRATLANQTHTKESWPALSLLRVLSVQSGEITLDGVDIDDLNLRWLRQQIAVVNRDPVLFASMSIYENVAAGSESQVSRARAMAAAKQANVHDAVMALPQQYDTLVGDLSADVFPHDHRQLLTIARAIVRDPKILILDHATDTLADTSIMKTTLDALMETIEATRLVFTTMDDNLGTETNRDPAKLSDVSVSNQDQTAVTRGEKIVVTSNQSTEDYQSVISLVDLIRLSTPHGSFLWFGLLAVLASAVAVLWLLVTVSTKASSLVQSSSESHSEANPAQRQNTDLGFVLFFLALLGVSLALFVAHSVFVVMQARSITHARALYLRGLCRQDMSYFDTLQASPTAIKTNLYALADRMGTLWGSTAAAAFLIVSILLVATIAAIVSSGDLVLGVGIVFVVCCCTGLELIRNRVPTPPSSHRPRPNATEFLDHLGTVVSLGLEEHAIAAYHDQVETQMDALQKTTNARRAALLGGASSFLALVSYAIVMWYGTVLVARGTLSMDACFRTLVCLSVVLLGLPYTTPLLAFYARHVQDARRAGFTISEMIDRPVAIDASSDDGHRPRSFKGKIEFRDVTFQDPSQIGGLHQFSATIDAGETVAFCGAPDAGQSSIVALLERFYDPTEGDVLLDGVHVKRLHVASLRDTIGLLDQRPALFAGGDATHCLTMADNIAYGMRPAPPQRKIDTAGRLAAAQVYRAKVHVTELSLLSGRSECLALARAIVKNPSVLVLEDVVSPLTRKDGRELVEEGIDKVLASKKRTTIFIGHELAASRRADKIFVLANGRVVEQGTHDELLARGGVYTKLLASV